MDNNNLEELEQIEKHLELNIEDEQPIEVDENIENVEDDEFTDIEFISQDEVKRKKLRLVKGQIFRTIVMFIALAAFSYASYELTLIFLENDTTFATKDKISGMFLQDVDDLPEGNVVYDSNGETIIMENTSDGKAFVWDYQKMLEYNKESVGYIRQGSGEYIDYPILQHSDNDYYLYHLPDHKWSSMGSIFLDYRIEGGLNADYSIVYGHYIGKRANNIMFGSLNWYWNRYQYHIDNPDFDIYVEDRHYKYYVFSIMKVPASGDRVYNPYFANDEQRYEFFKEVESKSKYEFTKAPEITMDSKVIMLSTCTTDEDVRFVMFLVRGEEIYDVPGVDYENDSSGTEQSGEDTTTQAPTTDASATTQTTGSNSETGSVSSQSTTSKNEGTSVGQTTTTTQTTTAGQSTTSSQTTSTEQTTTVGQTTTTEQSTTPEQTTTVGQEQTDETTTPESTTSSEETTTPPETTTPSETTADIEPSGEEDSGSSSEDTTTEYTE